MIKAELLWAPWLILFLFLIYTGLYLLKKKKELTDIIKEGMVELETLYN